jgi:hypothetical protein
VSVEVFLDLENSLAMKFVSNYTRFDLQSPGEGLKPELEKFMDFIERWFRISPDGGDGSTEILCALAVVCLLVAVLFRKRIALTLRGWRVAWWDASK